MTETQIREKVVATAKAWIGYNEADGSHRQIVDVYNSHRPLARGYALKYTDAWCAGFVSAVAIKLSLTDIMPTEVGVWNMIELYRKLGRWQESDSYVPKPGDVIMYAWSDNGVGDCTSGASHVGIVVACDGKTITVIEGNKANAVGYREIAVNGRYIRGFGLPDYASKATENEPVSPAPATNKEETIKMELRMLKRGMSGNDVRAAMLLMKDKGYYPYTIPASDKLFGPKMEAGVRKMQAEHNLGVDGLIGFNSWTFLLK
jgi:hypothetical protein|nr:MAG TPA_asm: CHAP domain protein [Caudoviricetes sp.]